MNKLILSLLLALAALPAEATTKATHRMIEGAPLNVKDFATPQAAIDACTAVGGRLYFPPGVYSSSAPLSVTGSGGCFIYGAPWRYVAGSPTGGSVILNTSVIGGHALTITGTGNGAVHIERLSIMGNPLSGRGIDATNAYNLDIENVWVQGHGDDGVRLTRCWAAKVHRLVSVHNGFNGLTLADRPNNIVVRDSVLNGNASKGGSASNLAITSPNTADPDYNGLGIVIEGNDIEGAGQSPFAGYTVSAPTGAFGVSIQGVDGLTFRGNYLEGAKNYLLYMDGSVSSWEVSGNYFQDGLVDIELAKKGRFYGNVASAYNSTTTVTVNAGDRDDVQAWGTTLRHGATTSYPNSVKERVEQYGATTPATGTWAVGDIVWRKAPYAGGNIGWVCTAAGTPGTWVPIPGGGAANVADTSGATLPNLETSLNSLKAVLRAAGVMQ